jgi:hypothetical protein
MDLPDEWDRLADSYYQRKKFLIHCEKWNHCNQRYYLGYDRERLFAGAVVYTLQLNLFTYNKLKLPLVMQIVGMPCSVSSSGLFGKARSKMELFKFICSQEKGLKIALNIDSLEDAPNNLFNGHTLPSIEFNNDFTSVAEYLKSLRADYRHRIDKIKRKSNELQLSHCNCSNFDKEMYEQYRNVYDHSKAKLELLDYEFFKNLPNDFKLTTATLNGQPAGWFITLIADNEMQFFLGGLDYSLNKKLGTYHRLLMEIIFQGINSGVKRIDLGQTAEIPKLRLGGTVQSKYMIASHNNFIINTLLRNSKKLLEYGNTFPKHNVFRKAI